MEYYYGVAIDTDQSVAIDEVLTIDTNQVLSITESITHADSWSLIGGEIGGRY